MINEIFLRVFYEKSSPLLLYGFALVNGQNVEWGIFRYQDETIFCTKLTYNCKF